jgi:hypothetical protein
MDLTKDISAYFATAGALVDAAAKVDEELALHLGHGFNVFDFIAPSENGISDILRDLLDPRGPHGQGDRFLRLFLQSLGLARLLDDTPRVDVYREHLTASIKQDRRRIDLVIEIHSQSKSWAVGIENKPWAIEQDNQLHDYATHLESRFSKQFHLVYLSGDGGEPSTLGEWEKQLGVKRLHIMPYAKGPAGKNGVVQSLYEWALEAATHAQADKIRWFLRDLAAWIATNFQTLAEDNHGRKEQ